MFEDLCTAGEIYGNFAKCPAFFLNCNAGTFAFLFKDFYIAQVHTVNPFKREPAHFFICGVCRDDLKRSIGHKDRYRVLLDHRFGHAPCRKNFLHFLSFFGDIVIDNKDTFDSTFCAGDRDAKLPELADSFGELHDYLTGERVPV